jgi:hypothetical protein
LEGIIHDHSQSQKTLFFEPLQVVPFNNEINMLMGEEREEEYRILTELSHKVREDKENLWRDLDLLGEMDLLYIHWNISRGKLHTCAFYTANFFSMNIFSESSGLLIPGNFSLNNPLNPEKTLWIPFFSLFLTSQPSIKELFAV